MIKQLVFIWCFSFFYILLYCPPVVCNKNPSFDRVESSQSPPALVKNLYAAKAWYLKNGLVRSNREIPVYFVLAPPVKVQTNNIFTHPGE